MSQRWDYIANMVFVKGRLIDKKTVLLKCKQALNVNAQYTRAHKNSGQQ